ncbi:hypothetical protein K470DRAFT_263916 [Piedraia hortae CBS 480.64]|uniref:C2H2-type domain-containing protein n=1 Tax=Piedraia hortae CBS 480.64 TaxID=1314780 RepID=A0A6A7C238_9PEZI|nr:hypothetical protein K470DRAFT_263916 [Piedraia hortae CBS 480.64]
MTPEYFCSICDRRFLHRSSVNRHQKGKHPDRPEELAFARVVEDSGQLSTGQDSFSTTLPTPRGFWQPKLATLSQSRSSQMASFMAATSPKVYMDPIDAPTRHFASAPLSEHTFNEDRTTTRKTPSFPRNPAMTPPFKLSMDARPTFQDNMKTSQSFHFNPGDGLQGNESYQRQLELAEWFRESDAAHMDYYRRNSDFMIHPQLGVLPVNPEAFEKKVLGELKNMFIRAGFRTSSPPNDVDVNRGTPAADQTPVSKAPVDGTGLENPVVDQGNSQSTTNKSGRASGNHFTVVEMADPQDDVTSTFDTGFNGIMMDVIQQQSSTVEYSPSAQRDCAAPATYQEQLPAPAALGTRFVNITVADWESRSTNDRPPTIEEIVSASRSMAPTATSIPAWTHSFELPTGPACAITSCPVAPEFNYHPNPDFILNIHNNSRITTWNTDLRDATPIKAALPAMELGLREIACYLPTHMEMIPELNLRFRAHGIGDKFMARIALYHRGRLTHESVERVYNKMRRQHRKNYETYHGPDSGFMVPAIKNALMRPENYHGGLTRYHVGHILARHKDYNNLGTYPLAAMARGVTIAPSGEDRGILTQVIEYATLHEPMATVKDIGRIVKEQKFTMPLESQDRTVDWDDLAAQRAKNDLETFDELQRAGCLAPGP